MWKSAKSQITIISLVNEMQCQQNPFQRQEIVTKVIFSVNQIWETHGHFDKRMRMSSRSSLAPQSRAFFMMRLALALAIMSKFTLTVSTHHIGLAKRTDLQARALYQDSVTFAVQIYIPDVLASSFPFFRSLPMCLLLIQYCGVGHLAVNIHRSWSLFHLPNFPPVLLRSKMPGKCSAREFPGKALCNSVTKTTVPLVESVNIADHPGN